MKGTLLRRSSKFLLLWMVGILLSVQAFAQSMTVKGVVKDNTGFGVIGASVQIKGTTKGAITDLDGNFTLQANKGDIIVISYIGYKTQEGRHHRHQLHRLQDAGVARRREHERPPEGRHRDAG